MRSIALTALLALCCGVLGGCQTSGEVENQAYVLVLGVDKLDDGQLELTARVPRIGKGGSEEAEAQGGDAYLTFTAHGASWVTACEALQWATPRQMNLSHIEMVVASEALAGAEDFPGLIDQIVETPHLYATARFVVCEGSAKAFVEAGKTVIGTRMSAELRAMLRHYAEEGFVPSSSLAEVYYAANSIYSDPTAIHGHVLPDAGADDQSPSKHRFSGAALFRGGRYLEALSVDETRLLNLILGEAATLPLEWNGTCCELTPEGAPGLDVEIDGASVRVSLSVALSTMASLSLEDMESAGRMLESRILALVNRCQRLHVEPFGLAARAASRFLTVKDWLAYDWRNRFAGADVAVSVSIRQLIA